MRHTKKIIALVLVFAIVFAFAQFAGAVTYKDQSEIDPKYQVALDMLNELKIMQGSTTGNFLPKHSLTRGEIMKMLFVIYNGGRDDASIFTNIDVTWQDVPADQWFAGYVKWGYTMSIISGKSDIRFAPNEYATGFEILKMVLGVAGFDQDIERFVGTGWENNVLARAFQLYGLMNNLDDIKDFSKEITREQAAQLMYNLIYCQTVDYNNGRSEFKDQTVGERRLGLRVLIGLLEGVGVIGLDNNPPGANKIRLADVYNISGIANNVPTVVPLDAQADINLIGRYVKVFAQASVDSDGKVKLPVSKIFGRAILAGTDSAFEVSAADLKYNNGNPTASPVEPSTQLKYTSGSTTYTTTATTSLYINYSPASIPQNGKAGDKWGAIADDNPVIVIYNDKKEITYILAREYTFSKITVAANGKVTAKPCAGGGADVFTSIDKDNIIEGASLATDGNYVLVAKIGDNYQLLAVDTFKGTCTRGSAGANSVTISGKTYELSSLKGAESSLAFAYNNLNKEQDFYAWNGKLLTSTLPATPDVTITYCVVTEISYIGGSGLSGSNSVELRVLKDDGKDPDQIYVLNEAYESDGTTKITKNPAIEGRLAGKLLSYTVSDNKITLKELASVQVQAGANWSNSGAVSQANPFTKGATRLTVTNGATPPSTEIFSLGIGTVFFVTSASGKWYRYIGYGALPDGSTAASDICGMVVGDRNSSTSMRPVTAVAIDTQDNHFIGASLDKYVVLAKKAYAEEKAGDTKTYHYYEVFDGATFKVYKAEKVWGDGDDATGGNVPKEALAGTIIRIDSEDGNMLTGFDVIPPDVAVEDKYESGKNGIFKGYIADFDTEKKIFIANRADGSMGPAYEFNYDSNTKFYAITDLTEGAEAGKAFTKAELETTDGGTDEKYNIIVTVSDGKITSLYYLSDGVWG